VAKIAFYCKCGGAWTGTLSPVTDEKIAQLTAIFHEAHSDPGCGPTTRADCRRARAKAERESVEKIK
jgi:hypothetical protein